MRLEIFILLITSFFVYNTYHDGKYTKVILSYKKYYKISFYIFLGIGIYLILKKDPVRGKALLTQTNNLVKYMPIDKNTTKLINPILDFTNFTTNNDSNNSLLVNESNTNNIPNRILTSGKNSNKRSVSETKKKYIASQQNWICNHCQKQLDHTYEIDHKLRLEHGGTNDVNNLVALCRNCHGIKTAGENM